ncbi:hypothetical protein HK102_013145, partial [Quaeritorhiza haematococci]
MIKLLTTNQIDIAIALTEGLLSSLCNGETRFRIVGTYTSTPLTWAISTAPNPSPNPTPSPSPASQRVGGSGGAGAGEAGVEGTTTTEKILDNCDGDVPPVEWEELKGKRIGISRFGSGSHIIPFVLADRMGWLKESSTSSSSSSSSSSTTSPITTTTTASTTLTTTNGTRTGTIENGRDKACPFEFVVLKDFGGLREGVRSGR